MGTLWPLAPRYAEVGAPDRSRANLELTEDVIRDLGLDGEHVFDRSVPLLRPDMGAGLRIDKLRGGADTPALALDRAFQHIADIQFAADLAHVRRFALVGFGRISGDHVDVANPGQIGDNVLGQAVGQPAGGFVAAIIVEGQHRHRGIGAQRDGLQEPPGPGARQKQCYDRGR